MFTCIYIHFYTIIKTSNTLSVSWAICDIRVHYTETSYVVEQQNRQIVNMNNGMCTRFSAGETVCLLDACHLYSCKKERQ